MNNTQTAPIRPFAGEDHLRYPEWRDEVAAGNTLLGLAEWLEHNPADEEIARLEAERAELADGISDTCDSEFDRAGRASLEAWDKAKGERLALLKASIS